MVLRLLSLLSVLAVAIAPAWAKVVEELPAGSGAPGLCLAAADRAAARHGIPPQMMRAITLVETRRTVNGATGPWPWTLNISGEGFWHASRSAALSHVEREMALGKRSIDLGCFQLNYRWHGENFSSPDAMLDPALAADYAARFLAELHAETGDWIRAAGLYHSRTPIHADRYRRLVKRTLARFGVSSETLASLGISEHSGETPAPKILQSGGARETKPRIDGYAEPGAGALTGRREGTGRDATAPNLAPAPTEVAGPSPAEPRAASAGAVVLTLFTGQGKPLLRSAMLRP